MNKQKFKQILSNKKSIRCFILFLIIISVIISAYILGYIPFGLSVKPPIGNIEQIQIEKYLEKYPEIDTLPNLDKILYDVIETDKSIELVSDEYKEELENDGYSLKYEGTGYLSGKKFRYFGYLKGITAVGIILSDEADEDVNHKTIVVYMTGNAFDFIPMVNWYKEKYNPNDFS